MTGTLTISKAANGDGFIRCDIVNSSTPITVLTARDGSGNAIWSMEAIRNGYNVSNTESIFVLKTGVGGWGYQEVFRTTINSPPQTTWRGALNAPAYNTTSDRRLKTNITKIEGGLEKVMQLNPVSYDKKHALQFTTYDKPEFGFIEQELQPIFPKGVVTVAEDNDQLLSVNYNALIPVLTKAIQEQEVKIENQQKNIESLQKEIEELKAIVIKLIKQ